MVSPSLDLFAPIHEPQVYVGLPNYKQAPPTPSTQPSQSESESPSERALELFPGADYSQLSSIPRESLCNETPEGQDLRLRLLEGSHIVFFGAGYRGKQFIYERAASLGVNVIIVDEPDSWVRDLVASGVVSTFIGIDINQHDHELIYEQTLEALQNLERVDGLCTMFELSVSVVARLCEALNLPGSSLSAIDTARDKHAARNALEKSGLPSIRHTLIGSEADLEAAAAYVGFPAVLKPVSGAASLGVKKVNTKDDLASVYAEGVALFSDMVLVNGDFVHNSADTEHTVEFGSFMLEEYMDGPEVDIDLVISEGKCTYACVHDNGPTLEPYFAETWDLLPSRLPAAQVDALEKMAIDSVVAMGFSQGIFHVEGKFTSRGPRLIEVNARMGGGTVHMMHKSGNGVDLVDEQLLLAAGIPSMPVILPENERRAVACATINAPKSGTISNLAFARQWDSIDGVSVVCNHTLISEGDTLVGPEHGQPTWLADIVYTAPAKDLAFVGELVEKMQVEGAAEFLRHYD